MKDFTTTYKIRRMSNIVTPDMAKQVTPCLPAEDGGATSDRKKRAKRPITYR